MKIIDILKAPECKKLFGEIQEFVRIELSEYNDLLERNEIEFSNKDIFDFVWGTINFSQAEICVLDSPLLQRLRRIHHLGLADVVYCNANSTRFSHTIGVMEVAGRMANVVNAKLERNQKQKELPYDFQEIVRMAALFHDAGHMFYSHVSELYFSHDVTFPRYDEITKAKTFFCEQTSSETALHELISVMIVQSSETIRLFKNISPYMTNSKLLTSTHYEQFADYISSLIIGVPVDQMILPYSSIINGAIDADKLDYLSRDSECTKVPIAVDIARIIQKLDVVNTKMIDFPAIWNGAKREDELFKIMAIKNSAKKVFGQLLNARSSMYESVYYHHKVLTAESMFRDGLSKIYRELSPDKISFTEIMQWTDDIFNDYWYLTVYPRDLNKSSRNEISSVFKAIRDRKLYKRVAAFSRDSLQGELSIVCEFFKNVIQDKESGECHRFIDTLKEEYFQIRKLLGCDNNMSEEPVFTFVYAKYDAMGSMPVENGNGYCKWSSSMMKQETMEAGKKSKQEQFYLLSNCKDRSHVYLALEKALYHFGIKQLAQEASICSKVTLEELNQKRRRLLEKNYYQDSMFLLQDDIFIEMLDKTLFNNVLEKYQSYMGTNSCRIDEDNLIKFLRQSLWLSLTKDDLETLLDGELRLLNSAHYIDRSTFGNLIDEPMEKLLKLGYKQNHILVLGGQFDSAQHLLYFFNDTTYRKSMIFDGSIEAALETSTEGSVLCFFDDAAYSGRQVISIFQELMGVPVEERTTREHHVEELAEEYKCKLRQMKIVLLYLYFNEKAESYIVEELNKLGIMDVQILYSKSLSSKIFDHEDKIFKNPQQKKLVQQNLQLIGESLLESSKKLSTGEYKERWDEERVKNSALGYNDAQQMVIFANNVPTYTLTAFWANGTIQNNAWKGLFQRTNKD